MALERLIGRFEGSEIGPLLICFGGMHGNELAGIQALELVFHLLEIEPGTNSNFRFYGNLVGLRGNLRAIELGQRFLEKDLNRQWKPEVIDRVFGNDPEQLRAEDREIFEIMTFVRKEIDRYQPEKLVILDLHTTSAYGGIFTIVNDDPESLRIGVALHAPVVKGLLRGIQGTTLHYFTDDHFPVRTIAVSFEAGQHGEVLSVNRTVAAVINCLQSIGCVDKQSVENRHDELLINFSRGLPKVTELIRTHTVADEKKFRLLPGFKNFQPVERGQLLGYDKTGEIRADEDGLLLMPKYQSQGDDGFFLIRNVNGYFE